MKKKTNEPVKENSKFSHPLKRGWLRPYLFGLSDIFDKRWWYWTRTILNKKPLDEPIPRILFDDNPHHEAKKNILECIKFMETKGHFKRDSWMVFIEWLLWGFGAGIQKEFPVKVTEDVSWYWYKTFNMGLMMQFPCDYMSWGSCEIAGMSHSKNGNGYFPTPANVVKMMVQMTMTDADKTKTVSDPCLGTGIMLLEASNYSLRLYGQDISLDMCKMATVNAWLYIPWLAHPAEDQIDWTTDEDRAAVIRIIDEWKTNGENQLLMLQYKPKTNTLGDWI